MFHVFTGKTSGLLGYWDDNIDKEYLLPNKVFLNTASTMSDIHHNFGQRCKFLRFGEALVNHLSFIVERHYILSRSVKGKKLARDGGRSRYPKVNY